MSAQLGYTGTPRVVYSPEQAHTRRAHPQTPTHIACTSTSEPPSFPTPSDTARAQPQPGIGETEACPAPPPHVPKATTTRPALAISGPGDGSPHAMTQRPSASL